MPRIQAIELLAPGTFSPILEVEIRAANNTLTAFAIVDSGADQTIVSGETLEAMGIPFPSLQPNPQPNRGAGGAFKTAFCDGTVHWKKWEVEKRLLVAEPGTLGGLVLLGRDEFFKKFVVKFCWHRQPPYFDVDPVS